MSAPNYFKRTFTREGWELAQTINAYQRIFNSPDGQEILKDLARVTGYFEISDEGHTAEHNARRSVFQHVLSMLSFGHEEMQQMAQLDYQEQLEMTND